MSKTERKWLKEVFIALSKFLKELAKLLKEFRLLVFREVKTKNERYDKWFVLSSVVFILGMWIWARYFY